MLYRYSIEKDTASFCFCIRNCTEYFPKEPGTVRDGSSVQPGRIDPHWNEVHADTDDDSA